MSFYTVFFILYSILLAYFSTAAKTLFQRNLNQFVNLLNNTSIINFSYYLNDLINQGIHIPMSPYFKSFNYSYIKSINSSSETIIKLASNTNNFVGAVYNLYSAFIDNSSLKEGEDYNIYDSQKKPDKAQFFSCRYIPSSISFNKTIIPTIPIDHYVRYYKLGFGYDDDKPGVKGYKFYNNAFEIMDLDNLTNINFSKNTTFIRMLLANQYLRTTTFLVLQDSKFNVYMFNLTLSGSMETIKYFTKIEASYLNNSYLTDAAVFKTYIILGCNNSLFFLNYNKTINSINSSFVIDSFKSTNGTIIKYQKINSLLYIDKSLYISYSNYGLKIINITFLENLNKPIFTQYEFLHPNLNKLDAIRNPYNNLTFIGISILNNTNNSELFVELVANNLFLPEFNKVFIAGSPIIYNDYFSDSFYTYIFDRNNFKLIIIRRARVSVLDEYFNIILDLSKEMKGILNPLEISTKNPVWLFYDFKTGTIDIGIPNTKDNNMILIENLSFHDRSLSCRFFKSGNYSLNFIGNSEYCGESLLKNQNSYCKLNVNVKLGVNIKEDDELLVLYVVLGILLFIVMFGVCFFFCYKYRCFRLCIKTHKYNSQKYMEAERNNKGGVEAPDEVIEVQIEQK